MLRILFLLAACARIGAQDAATCNETEWPDKDGGLVCGECKVLVNNFNSKYYTCNGYCAAIGRKCTGAWEESYDTCTVAFDMTCDQTLSSSDAICECMEESTCDVNASKCDSSNGGDCCTSRTTQAEERRCRDGWVPIYTGIGCAGGEGNEFTCYHPSCSALPADNCGPNSCSDGNCNPNPFKCDSSIGGDCCTARDTSYEDRRCRDGWIPIYTGVGCGWPHHDGEANMFTCYSPTCSNLPEDNCGPNSCYDGEKVVQVIIIVIVVIAALAIIGTLGGVYGCYKGKCCCFSQQPKPPQPMAQSAVAQPVIPMVQPATMAYQAQPVAQQTQPGMTKVV